MEIKRNKRTIMCGPCKTDTLASARLSEIVMGHKAIIYCGYEQQRRADELFNVTLGFLLDRLESWFPP